ncbi:hypothetical protein DFJ43DRAFT_995109 [Lentinula guzmanii]|uniref:Uncharacterized protein n=1 Tax=Lentinula guzmanii TaxID=2804957 RepID=A0AA38JMD4_9AGAR|nr:hypothetical protein DFJ43DRAFT_995109 [Lentinula guzmanii]
MVHNKRALEGESENCSVKAIKRTHLDSTNLLPNPQGGQINDHGSSDFTRRISIIKEEEESPFDDQDGQLKLNPLQELSVMPHIWAQSRQEVCESFEWFRSYQSGVYFANNVTKGYLLSGFPAKRDGFFHCGKLIISHGGGKAESVQQSKGQMKLRLADDQKAEDKSVRALLTNYRQQIPLVLLVDDRYALFPYNLGGKNITYAVLGVYTITHTWAEYEITKSGEKHVRFKFSFQWCEEQDVRTYHPYNITETYQNCHRPGLADRKCSHCEMPSPLIFSVGWVCLNATCNHFWHLPGAGDNLIPDELNFHESFLQLRPLAPLDNGFRDINPPQPVTKPSDKITTLQSFTRGMHCKRCGRLSCRSKWEHWECAHCHNVLAIIGTIRPVRDLRGLQPTVNFEWYFVGKNSGMYFATYNGTSSYFRRGKIHHIQHNSRGPRDLARLDTLFEEYQKQAADGRLPFRRWPLRSVVRGVLLTNYFSQNFFPQHHSEIHADRYQYVGGTANTLSWEEAPTAVVDAKNFIEERTKQALNNRNSQDFLFNEVLSAAYMEKQKMSGDILVMDGTGVQQYYEHMVEPTNFRIAATARLIDSDRK